MKRLPILFSLLAVIALSASAAYWGLQLYKPVQRQLAAAPVAVQPDPAPDAAATLFGGQAVAAMATNYQLTGVVFAGQQSVAILVADGQPPRALPMGKEIAPGVTIKEVHPRYVMLSEGGILKRIDLATDAKAGASVSFSAPPAPPDAAPQVAPMPPPQGGGNEMTGGNPPPPPAPTPMPPPTRSTTEQQPTE